MFYTTSSAAIRLGIPQATLRMYIRQGLIRCGKRPGKTIYAFSEQQLKDAMRIFEEGDDDGEEGLRQGRESP